MNNNYKIIRTIFENVFQRVLECRDNDTGDIFYSNIITSRKVMNLINLEELKSISSNILECYNTEDRIYIYTKPLETEYKGVRDYLTNKLTLKQQFILSENITNLAQNIFNMTDVVQQKILDIDKLYVDSDNKIYVDCNLIFEQEYDIADNETFKRLGNMIHFIFSGTEIIDYNISDTIAPDILKIIVRCLTREYVFPNDVLKELKDSPIYSMIFGINGSGKNEKVMPNEKPLKDKVLKEKNAKENNEMPEPVPPENSDNTYEEAVAGLYKEDDDTPVYDIFVNDNNPPRQVNKIGKHFTRKEIIRAAVSILIVVLVLLAGNKLIKMLSAGEEASSGNVQNNNENSEVTPPPEGNSPDGDQSSQSEISDSTEMYFSDKLLSSIGYTGNKAEIDSNIYVEGKNSLVVANEGEEKIKALFAAVDFKDEKFSYMLKKQIGIAAKMKSESEVTVQVVLEAYKNGSLTSNFHTSAKVSNDIWSQFTVPINVTDADSLNIYLEYEGKNKVWIDSVYIDVIK